MNSEANQGQLSECVNEQICDNFKRLGNRVMQGCRMRSKTVKEAKASQSQPEGSGGQTKARSVFKIVRRRRDENSSESLFGDVCGISLRPANTEANKETSPKSQSIPHGSIKQMPVFLFVSYLQE